jgi:hypothetical protein
VAIGIERPAVAIEITLKLDRGDRQAAILKHLGQRAGEDALTQPAHHRAKYHHVFGLATAISGRHGGVELGFLGHVPGAREQVFSIHHVHTPSTAHRRVLKKPS